MIVVRGLRIRPRTSIQGNRKPLRLTPSIGVDQCRSDRVDRVGMTEVERPIGPVAADVQAEKCPSDRGARDVDPPASEHAVYRVRHGRHRTFEAARNLANPPRPAPVRLRRRAARDRDN